MVNGHSVCTSNSLGWIQEGSFPHRSVSGFQLHQFVAWRPVCIQNLRNGVKYVISSIDCVSIESIFSGLCCVSRIMKCSLIQYCYQKDPATLPVSACNKKKRNKKSALFCHHSLFHASVSDNLFIFWDKQIVHGFQRSVYFLVLFFALVFYLFSMCTL